MILGQFGLFKVRYLGDVNGKWKGIVTGHLYEFSRDARERYVDRRDIPPILGLKDGEDHSLFEMASAMVGALEPA